MNCIYKILFIFIGAGLAISVMLALNGYFNYEINIIDLLMLIATVALSIIVLYLTKRLEKKDIIRDITISDLNELCSLYNKNSESFKDFESKKISLEQLQKDINMTFFKADLMIDRINLEFKESFTRLITKYPDSRLEFITRPYWKWVTDGELMKKDFKFTPTYMKGHETKLSNVITQIKLVIHQLVKLI